jgi:serine/threonine protein kinase
MSPAKVQTITTQLLSAVCHMHLKPKVVHCDIKPENIIVSETTTSICIKIIDFDTARIEPEVPSFGSVGTFPFSAPEMELYGEYDPYAADMWSMGIVILEVLCCMKIVEKSLGFAQVTSRAKKKDELKEMTSRIANYFAQEEAVACLLQVGLRPELATLVNHVWYEFLKGLLQIDPLQRSRAQEACKQNFCDDASQARPTSKYSLQ